MNVVAVCVCVRGGVGWGDAYSYISSPNVQQNSSQNSASHPLIVAVFPVRLLLVATCPPQDGCRPLCPYWCAVDRTSNKTESSSLLGSLSSYPSPEVLDFQ